MVLPLEALIPMRHGPIQIENRQSISVNTGGLSERLQHAIVRENRPVANLVVALVDDVEIQRINREFLQHDWPTDVVSFSYADNAGTPVDGELVVSVETAAREGPSHGWSLDDELLLYCVHGFLHLCGYDDLTDEARPLIRRREAELLAPFGLVPRGLET